MDFFFFQNSCCDPVFEIKKKIYFKKKQIIRGRQGPLYHIEISSANIQLLSVV